LITIVHYGDKFGVYEDIIDIWLFSGISHVQQINLN